MILAFERIRQDRGPTLLRRYSVCCGLHRVARQVLHALLVSAAGHSACVISSRSRVLCNGHLAIRRKGPAELVGEEIRSATAVLLFTDRKPSVAGNVLLV
jgi:hypothetical protein